MTHLARRLARRAHRALEPEDADRLRMLTATNLTAGIGELGGVGELLTRLPYDTDRGPSDTAMLTSVRLHARTQDDFYPHGRVHVGAITLPAALAFSEQCGDRLLECLGAGYEVMTLAAEGSSAYAQQRGLRPSGVFGPLGAAATAARALGYDEAATANTIALAAALCGGTNQAWLSGTSEWLFVTANAARVGVEAALLTESGVAASEVGLEGSAGWGAAYFGDPGLADLHDALEDTSSRIRVVAAKSYPVSGIAQLAAHLSVRLQAEPLDRPSKVSVHLAPAETRYPGTVNAGPFQGRADALMSVPFVVACGLTHGEVSLARLEDPQRAGVDHLVPLIEVVADASLDEAEATLVVEDAGGGVRRESIDGQIMFPDWEQVREDPDGLAGRSEAPISLTRRICAELGEARPDAHRLRSLLLEGR